MSRVGVALTLLAFAAAAACASTNMASTGTLTSPDCTVTPTSVHPVIDYDPRLGEYAVVAVRLDNASPGCPAREVDVQVQDVNVRGHPGDTIQLPQPVVAADVTRVTVRTVTESAASPAHS